MLTLPPKLYSVKSKGAYKVRSACKGIHFQQIVPTSQFPIMETKAKPHVPADNFALMFAAKTHTLHYNIEFNQTATIKWCKNELAAAAVTL